MRDRAGVPELSDDPSAGGVDCVRNPSPTAHLLCAPQTGCVGPAESFGADGRRFGNNQSRGSALGIAVRLNLSGHVVDRTRPHPRQRCHDNSVRQIEIAHSKWGKERLSRHHTVTTIFPICSPASMKRCASAMLSKPKVRAIVGRSAPVARTLLTNSFIAASLW